MPSYLFTNYVIKMLKKNNINENELFTTSDENYGILKFESGTMYEDNGNSLEVKDIVWILEETDIQLIDKKRKTKHFSNA